MWRLLDWDEWREKSVSRWTGSRDEVKATTVVQLHVQQDAGCSLCPPDVVRHPIICPRQSRPTSRTWASVFLLVSTQASLLSGTGGEMPAPPTSFSFTRGLPPPLWSFRRVSSLPFLLLGEKKTNALLVAERGHVGAKTNPQQLRTKSEFINVLSPLVVVVVTGV